jgi:four helix bundle protein
MEKGACLDARGVRATREFPRQEEYGLTSQMRRAASSIPANIAEGCGRGGNAELARFLQIALGSASELEYHLILAHDLGYLEKESFERLTAETTEVKRMLTGLRRRLRLPSGATPPAGDGFRLITDN